MEGDGIVDEVQLQMEQFLPTPSHGGRPVRLLPKFCEYHFYPRPHMEGDLHHSYQRRQFRHFYPRPHMEGDGYTKTVKGISLEFLPTPSHGGRLRAPRRASGWGDRFLPTPSHGGRRGMSTWRLSLTPKFLPTPSHGGRPPIVTPGTPGHNFYPRPHMEGDIGIAADEPKRFGFLPTPSHGGRLLPISQEHRAALISTHALTWRATLTSSKSIL